MKNDRSYLEHLSKLPYFVWKAWLLIDWLRINLDFLISLPRVTREGKCNCSLHLERPHAHRCGRGPSPTPTVSVHTDGPSFLSSVWAIGESFSQLSSKNSRSKHKRKGCLRVTPLLWGGDVPVTASYRGNGTESRPLPAAVDVVLAEGPATAAGTLLGGAVGVLMSLPKTNSAVRAVTASGASSPHKHTGHRNKGARPLLSSILSACAYPARVHISISVIRWPISHSHGCCHFPLQDLKLHTDPHPLFTYS